MKIVSFNVNSIRTRFHQLEAVCQSQPDIICVQETKVQDGDFPLSTVQDMGYHAEFCGQKSYHGVATLSKKTPEHVEKNLGGLADDLDARGIGPEQARLLMTTHSFGDQTIDVYNGYFPQGESMHNEKKFAYKTLFYQHFTNLIHTRHNPADNVIVLGDLNISPNDLDIGLSDERKKAWLREKKCSFLPEERAMLAKLTDWGLTDTWRHLNPATTKRYSWFDYRSKGFDSNKGLRIDQIWCTAPLLKTLIDADIGYEVRGMERPSDHAPISSTFNLD